MKTSTKIWLIIVIISNIGMIYFFKPIIDSIKYTNNAVYFNFTTEAYIGLALFVIANISGPIVLLRFLKTQPLSNQIFFSIVPPTVTFMLLILFFFNIASVESDIASAVRTSLRITNETARYIWIGVIATIYLIYVFFICFIVSRPLKKIERAVESLKHGKPRKQIKIGGSKQFKNIEYDLNSINEKYKESDKIIKNIDPEVIEKAIEKANPKPQPPNLVIVK